MTTNDQDRVFAALHGKLEILEGPCLYKPHWWEFKSRKREAYIQQVLKEAGLPPLTELGRSLYYGQPNQSPYEDAGSAWSRKWCAALGLMYLSNNIHVSQGIEYDICPDPIRFKEVRSFELAVDSNNALRIDINGERLLTIDGVGYINFKKLKTPFPDDKLPSEGDLLFKRDDGI